MLNRIKDRKMIVWFVFLLLFFLLSFRLAQITIVRGDEYGKKSLDYRLQKHTEIARRGEIFDRNGELIAGNGTTLYLEYLYNYVENEKFEKMCIDLFSLLEEQNEDYIKLPIVKRNSKYIFESDYKKQIWLEKMNFSKYANAREIFDQISLNEGIAIELNPYSRQQLLISKGLYLPIGIYDDKDGVCKIEFLQDGEKYKFLDSYNLLDKDDKTKNISAKDAFNKLREYYDISDKYSDDEAYYILTMRHYIKNLGFLKFEPIEICDHISEQTSILISENKVDFPDISVGVKPYRYYPMKNTCSHIIGYMGPISTRNEIEKYNELNGYDYRDMIGKTGIEASYEDTLHGKRGVKWYDINASGEIVGSVGNAYSDKKFNASSPISGLDIGLTIDSDFQKKVEINLKKHINALRTGELYESKFDKRRFDKTYQFARTGAVVCVEVESSEILAMASYPDYDVNLFTGGISVEDWMSLQGNNNNDPLGPKPMYNLATMAAVQPGSTFKMVTSFAALEAGMDPYRKILTKGVIKLADGPTFGCWIWNMFGGSHGYIDMIGAIANSCNYYFYSVGSDYDYGSDEPLDLGMGAEKVTEAAAKFGLGERSGVEIDELVAGEPDPEMKKNIVISNMKDRMLSIANDLLPTEISENKRELEVKIDELVQFCLEHSDAARYEVFDFLENTFQVEDYDKLNKLTDIVKFDYMTQMGSFDSDIFNIAIGQGGNRYTPVQMARYVTAIANGGYLQKLTLVKTIDNKPAPREAFQDIDPNDNIKYLQMGMRAAVTDSSYQSSFFNFPIDVALKTGTAEREGKLSTLDEIEYLEKYCKHISDVPFEEISKRSDEILKQRSIELGELYSKIDIEKDDNKLIELQNELKSYNIGSYLDRGNAMRLAIKELSSGVITNEQIDSFKNDYDDFSAVIAYAPYDKPKIAIAIMIPQGGSGSNCFPLLKEIISDYFNL